MTDTTDTPIAADVEADEHDAQVPETVPDTAPVPDDDGAAVFAAATEPVTQDAPPEATPQVSPETAPEAAPDGITDQELSALSALVPSPDDSEDNAYTLAKDTNARIRNMETLVSGFVDDAKPVLEKFGQGGISGLVGMMFGK